LVAALLGLHAATFFLFTGCVSRPALARETFALTGPTAPAVATKTGTNVLAVRSCTVSPLFENRAFVYRIGPEAYEHDPYAGFLVSPGAALAIPVREYLHQCGAFRDVAQPGSLLAADCWLEVYISELYGDLRSPGSPAAVLSMRFILFRSADGNPASVWFDRTYSRRVPLAKNTAASVVAGWNEALAGIMAEVTAQLPNP
jgi:ABC-type uncharacterized transport system auxiliary subunit